MVDSDAARIVLSINFDNILKSILFYQNFVCRPQHFPSPTSPEHGLGCWMSMLRSLKDKFMGQNAPSKGAKKGGATTPREIEDGREYKLVCFFRSSYPPAHRSYWGSISGCYGRRRCR